jgi:charged multivesicular body protein 1
LAANLTRSCLLTDCAPQAIEKGDMETAKIYANNAIREKNQALNFLRLSSRIDAVSQRVQTAVSMGQLTKSMGSTVKGLDKVLATMDIEKISKVSWCQLSAELSE